MHCSWVQIAENALNDPDPVWVTRKLSLPACTSAAPPTVASAVPPTLTVTALPARVPETVVSDGAPPPPPPPPGPAGLPFLPPHPSMRDATVTNEIACAQNSRRDVFGLSMGARCASSVPAFRGSDIVR